ncbi:hypothetical protein HDZ31DRAFT_69237 [Schizophyllum fasciatum]
MYQRSRIGQPASSNHGPWDAKAATQRIEQMTTNVEQWTQRLATGERRGATWAKQAEGVRRYVVEQEAKICFVGVAGGGKSSVLNALLGMDVVPTSGQQACTASPLRIEYHDSPSISAEVAFLSRAEWIEELRVLFASVIDDHGRVKASEEIGKDGAAALQKLRVLCPSATNDQIATWARNADLFVYENPLVHRYLGSLLSIEGSDPQNFQANLAPFASSKDAHRGKARRGKSSANLDDQQALFWPLVRVITLRCNAPVLASGAVLLDLPGAGDSNRARVQVSEKWMKECKFVFIIAPIQRAVDDKIARDLQGTAFRLQMLMGVYLRSAVNALTHIIWIMISQTAAMTSVPLL